jgi:pilus assembly protein Flp/PilA
MGRMAYPVVSGGLRYLNHKARRAPKREVGSMNLFILKTWLQAKFTSDERGASMVEYGLLLALIAVIAIVAVRALGTGVSEKFSEVNSELN